MGQYERLMWRQEIEKQSPPPRFILFIDMLGFSALTETHPNPIVFDFESDLMGSETSESAKQLGRFQHVLDVSVAAIPDGLTPSYCMLFSDCAFVVYDTALAAALSATKLMQRFFRVAVPVRMGLAHGTWHVNRFSFDQVGEMTVSRAVFYGTGVVRANKAEKCGGKGCRIFVHSSLTPTDLETVGQNVSLLKTPEAHPDAPSELNYLHGDHGLDEMGRDIDWDLYRTLAAMRRRLTPPVPCDVDRQYTDTFDALNRMRTQLRRSIVSTS